LPRKQNIDDLNGINHLIEEELSYDANTLLSESQILMSQLNTEQLLAFDTIVNAVLSEKSGFYFVSGYGGTGKTFLWNAIVTHLRSYKKIVLRVASSGVASFLLPGGQTAHSRFKIPCDLDDTYTCNIKRGTILAELIKSTSLIIWDEAFMTHRSAFEALDRSLRDLLASDSELAEKTCFGGKVVVLGGDPRQILPVIENGTRPQIIDAAITNSPLWAPVSVLHLTKNMRLFSNDLNPETTTEIASFSKWILDIGEGQIAARSKEGESERWWIKIHHDMLLFPKKDSLPCMHIQI
jgi:ATP-dependent DNA helicase PIF1